MRRRYAAGGVTMDNLAGEYGVCKATVSAIVRDRAPHAPLKRLSGAQRDEIRQRYAAGGIKQRDLAAEYGVTNGTISNVITRRFKDPRT
jgi:plasmid maintenance system antidote protein VapI